LDKGRVKTLEELYERVDFKPTPEQRAAITNVEGPQLIIAGPGSGKTQVLVLRCLNLLLFKNVDPSKILICTYTEKAAASLQDRIRRGLREAGAEGSIDFSELWVGTIHSTCEEIINENLEETGLPKGYEVLDDLTQQLFLHEHFFPVLGKPEPLAYSHWAAIEKGIEYFTKITEDRVDVDKMLAKGDEDLQSIARKYRRYIETLKNNDRVDFPGLQSIVLDLLNNPRVKAEFESKFQYIMVDEYQDTNFIQEQIFLKLSKKTDNICVVGDEDQSLYRFRGATVQNFLRFPQHFKGMTAVTLEQNFRSTPRIISLLNGFINEPDWKDANGKNFRYKKTIRGTRDPPKNGMKSVYRLSSNSPKRVAKLIKELQTKGVVEDLNEIAILLPSVKNNGPPFFEALQSEGIKYYSPRAGAFFSRQEITLVVGALVHLFDFISKGNKWDKDLWNYYQEAVDTLKLKGSSELLKYVRDTTKELSGLKDSLKKGVVDLFYEILAYRPFAELKDEPVTARNLAIFSDLLTKFQDYYHVPVVRGDNMEKIRNRLFNSFLYAMKENGLDEYEDPRDIFPSGYVQVMTIHQSKGLEFPVVVVGGLKKRPRDQTAIDRRLAPFSKREEFEPYDSVKVFDHYRLFYVAFSRAIDLLLLASDEEPHSTLNQAFENAPELSPADIGLIKEMKFVRKPFLPPKPELSITGHIHAYEICPRQYKYYKEFEFAGSRSAGESFGTLIHYTIEDIHNHFLKKKQWNLNEDIILQYFDRNLRTVTRGGMHPLAQIFKKLAWDQVMDYFNNNKDMFEKLVQAEVPILVERPQYVMSGIIDLIRGDKGELELLDFKAQEKKDITKDKEEFYKFQLAIYAQMIARKIGQRPQKTYIYLTAEKNRKDALVEIPIATVEAREAEKKFDEKAQRILDKDFKVLKVPVKDVCRNCDFRFGCPERIVAYPEIRT
jgi:DNA helicase II / ATP-dependent DNA helicase PcrA